MEKMKDYGLLDCEDRPSIEENFKRVVKGGTGGGGSQYGTISDKLVLIDEKEFHAVRNEETGECKSYMPAVNVDDNYSGSGGLSPIHLVFNGTVDGVPYNIDIVTDNDTDFSSIELADILDEEGYPAYVSIYFDGATYDVNWSYGNEVAGSLFVEILEESITKLPASLLSNVPWDNLAGKPFGRYYFTASFYRDRDEEGYYKEFNTERYPKIFTTDDGERGVTHYLIKRFSENENISKYAFSHPDFIITSHYEDETIIVAKVNEYDEYIWLEAQTKESLTKNWVILYVNSADKYVLDYETNKFVLVPKGIYITEGYMRTRSCSFDIYFGGVLTMPDEYLPPGIGGGGVEYLIFTSTDEGYTCNKTFEEAWALSNSAVIPIIIGHGSAGNAGGIAICTHVYFDDYQDSEKVIECTYYSYFDSQEVGVAYNSNGEIIGDFVKSWE